MVMHFKQSQSGCLCAFSSHIQVHTCCLGAGGELDLTNTRTWERDEGAKGVCEGIVQMVGYGTYNGQGGKTNVREEVVRGSADCRPVGWKNAWNESPFYKGWAVKGRGAVREWVRVAVISKDEDWEQGYFMKRPWTGTSLWTVHYWAAMR